MKPENWADISSVKKNELAMELFNSARGLHLMNRALTMAAAIARNNDEPSSADDMDILAETLFFVDHGSGKLGNIPIGQLCDDDDDE